MGFAALMLPEDPVAIRAVSHAAKLLKDTHVQVHQRSPLRTLLAGVAVYQFWRFNQIAEGLLETQRCECKHRSGICSFSRNVQPTQ